jgi:serine/threonine-protein kinase RsbW/sigma-B regulation protein RsbU (phosphoserine phosphatase)
VALTDQFGIENRLPEAIVNDIHVVLDEALSNIVAYGYQASARGAIVVRLACRNSEVCIEVEDEGRAFDPLRAPPPDLSTDLPLRQIGGLGIHFIKSLMDVVSYDRHDGRNVLCMIKRVPALPEEPGRGVVITVGPSTDGQ